MGQLKIRKSVVFYLNGRRVEVEGDLAVKPLANFLRNEMDLPGTKIVCAEGDCGACTTLVSRYRRGQFENFQAINSCITPVHAVDLSHLVTVEGLQENAELSEPQKCMVENQGGQCGFCTPGMVCAMTALAEESLRSGKVITEKRARNYLTGNLCRCTGYEPILKAAQSISLGRYRSLKRYLNSDSQTEFQKLQSIPLHILGLQTELYQPTNLAELNNIKLEDYKIFAGSTDLGVLLNKDKFQVKKSLSLQMIPELSKIEIDSSKVSVGATVTISMLEQGLTGQCSELIDLLKIFASPQIKNSATLVGNIVNASPIADTIPALMVLQAQLVIIGPNAQRRVPISEFYKSYKVLAMKPGEIVTHVEFELPRKNQTLKLYKVSNRKDLDISAVTAAFLFETTQNIITDAKIAFGGVGPVVQRLTKIENICKGQTISKKLFEELGKTTKSQISPISDLRGSQQFRWQLSENLFNKCFNDLAREFNL